MAGSARKMVLRNRIIWSETDRMVRPGEQTLNLVYRTVHPRVCGGLTGLQENYRSDAPSSQQVQFLLQRWQYEVLAGQGSSPVWSRSRILAQYSLYPFM